MSSYLSSLLTNTTSRYASLRRTLLSNEEDGDTEDDSHISRVLRAYYTEKARPYPSWLPPDPNDRRAQQTPQPQAGGQGYYTSAGGRSAYGHTAPPLQGNRGSLNDLWDSPGTTAPAAPQSLRAGRRLAPPSGTARPESSPSLAPPQQPSGARPLPSQRAGSYQSMQSGASGRSAGGGMDGGAGGAGGGGGTAQERLKARLWGAARSASPGPGGQGGGGGGYGR